MPIGENNNVYHHMFIHNVLANFYKDTLDYFSDYLYPRFEWTVMGTYTKAVEYINKNSLVGRESDKPNLPALILNPSGEFQIGEGNMGAKQLFRFPNLAPGLVKRIYEPIYQDKHMMIHVGFSRFVGDIELIILPASFYEYCDLRIFIQQIFGGPAGSDRPISPVFFNSFIIIPEELKNYTYNNEYTNVNYQIDWTGANSSNILVETTNKTELVIPCKIKPLYRLSSLSDSSEKYGGTDNIADYKLSATLNFEIELPTFMLFQSDYLVENIEFNFGYGSAYTIHEEFASQLPINQETIITNWESPLDSTSHTTFQIPDPFDGTANTTTDITLPKEVENITKKSLVLNNRYFHIVTLGEELTEEFNIQLPTSVDEKDLIKVMGKHGKLKYGEHYELINNGNGLKIKQKKVKSLENDILELYIYDKKWSNKLP